VHHVTAAGTEIPALPHTGEKSFPRKPAMPPISGLGNTQHTNLNGVENQQSTKPATQTASNSVTHQQQQYQDQAQSYSSRVNDYSQRLDSQLKNNFNTPPLNTQAPTPPQQQTYAPPPYPPPDAMPSANHQTHQTHQGQGQPHSAHKPPQYAPPPYPPPADTPPLHHQTYQAHGQQHSAHRPQYSPPPYPPPGHHEHRPQVSHHHSGVHGNHGTHGTNHDSYDNYNTAVTHAMTGYHLGKMAKYLRRGRMDKMAKHAMLAGVAPYNTLAGGFALGAMMTSGSHFSHSLLKHSSWAHAAGIGASVGSHYGPAGALAGAAIGAVAGEALSHSYGYGHSVFSHCGNGLGDNLAGAAIGGLLGGWKGAAAGFMLGELFW
jgi:hypothetical protein